MADRPPISYANSIDPAGGITPSKDVFGQPLTRTLDAQSGFNALDAVPAKNLLPPVIASEQVRQSRLSPDGPKPPQPFYNAGAAYAHATRANYDHDRARAQVQTPGRPQSRPVQHNAPGPGTLVPPALSLEALQRLNYRFNAAKDQLERMEGQKHERKHGRRH